MQRYCGTGGASASGAPHPLAMKMFWSVDTSRPTLPSPIAGVWHKTSTAFHPVHTSPVNDVQDVPPYAPVVTEAPPKRHSGVRRVAKGCAGQQFSVFVGFVGVEAGFGKETCLYHIIYIYIYCLVLVYTWPEIVSWVPPSTETNMGATPDAIKAL